MTKPKVMIALNTSWNIVNFRSNLIRAMIDTGYEVIAVAPHDTYAHLLSAIGCRYVPMSMDNKGTNPVTDFMLFLKFYRLMRLEKPSVFLGYTIKPNVYGSLAAHILNIPVINNIAGLGSAFITGGWLNKLVRKLYRISLSRSIKVFFQNNDDRQIFITGKLVTDKVADLLPGSGIDLERFTPVPLPARNRVRLLLISRMLWEKGIGEFVAAARLLHQRRIDAEFCLLGFLDAQNPGAIPQQQISDWVEEGVVRYLGVTNNVESEIAQADCIVLPSYYREGTPRSLLEAAAMARPIVTTDSVGCRDVVDDGVNGYLCRPRDVADLAEKMAQLTALSSADRTAMGLRGRAKVERKFDEKIVINKYLEAISEILYKK